MKDPDYQRREWLDRNDLNALDNVLMDFDSNMEGLDKWDFPTHPTHAYRIYASEVAHALFPVYVAISECWTAMPQGVEGLEDFLKSEALMRVIQEAEVAFQFLDKVVEKDGGDGPSVTTQFLGNGAEWNSEPTVCLSSF